MQKKESTPPREPGGRLLIQILICTTIICGFMFFRDTPAGDTTIRRIAEHFINYTVDLKDVIEKAATEVIPVNGTVESEGN